MKNENHTLQKLRDYITEKEVWHAIQLIPHSKLSSLMSRGILISYMILVLSDTCGVVGKIIITIIASYSYLPLHKEPRGGAGCCFNEKR